MAGSVPARCPSAEDAVHPTLTTTTHQGPSGCTSCNYDPLGNVLTSVDARKAFSILDR